MGRNFSSKAASSSLQPSLRAVSLNRSSWVAASVAIEVFNVVKGHVSILFDNERPDQSWHTRDRSGDDIANSEHTALTFWEPGRLPPKCLPKCVQRTVDAFVAAEFTGSFVAFS